MPSFLIFLLAIGGIFLVAIVVNKIKGVKAQYIDAWQRDIDEQIRFEDKAADFHPVTILGRAGIMSFARLKRTHAIVTTKRIVIAQKVFLGKRYMITHMLYLNKDVAPADELSKLSGGLYSKGYQVWLTPPDKFTVETDGKKPYLKIIPDNSSSATNIEHCRLYSDESLANIVGLKP